LASHATDLSRQDAPALAGRVPTETARRRIVDLLQNVKIERLKTRNSFWQLPQELFPPNAEFEGIAYSRNGNIVRIDLPAEKNKVRHDDSRRIKIRKEMDGFIVDHQGRLRTIPLNIPIIIDGPLFFDIESQPEIAPFPFAIRTSLQGVLLK